MSGISYVGHRTEVRPVEMTDGSSGYMASDPDLEGCVGYGATEDEATQSLEDARKAYLAVSGETEDARAEVAYFHVSPSSTGETVSS